MVSTGLGLVAMVFAPLARPASRPASGAQVVMQVPEAPASSVPQETGEAPSRPARLVPREPAWIEGHHARAFVYPPKEPATSARPVTVLLHGLCGHPQRSCAPFADVATDRGWLVCPNGEDVCGTGAKWRLAGPEDAQVVEASVEAVRAENEGEVESAGGRVLVGFSLGGTAAMLIAQASPPGRYEGLVVVAAQVRPDVRALERAGIKRVVFAAGDFDMTSPELRAHARTLEALGLPARFVSLGRFGHGYPADMEERMREPMKWVSSG
jgi:predicted esterase